MDNLPSLLARTIALIPLAEVDRSNRLLADYLLSVPAATDLFAHAPEDMVEVAQHSRAQANRPRLADALTDYQRCLGADDAAIANARLLADPATPVVTTGQQPGLLTGPLYTVYKAITAVNVAHRLTEDLGRPVVPVFWAGTDDDDRNEIDHCGCWDQHLSMHSLRYPEAGGHPGQLVGNLPAQPFGEEVLAQIEPLIDGLPYAHDVRALLRATLEDSADLGAWFSRLLSRLFSRWGLVICDPRLPAVRQLSAEVLHREIAAPLHTTALISDRARELRARGYRPQLHKPSDVCNLFMLDDVRHRVTFRDDAFYVDGERIEPCAMRQQLADAPERFAPNAVLRPVVQEYLLASAVFIAGPNELGYWAELHPVFQALGVEMPPVLPRAQATVVPAPIARYLHQWNINPLRLLHDYDQARYDLLSTEQPEPIERAFAHSRAQIKQLAEQLSALVGNVDATLTQSAAAAQQRMLHEIDRLERKTLLAVERQSSVQTDRLERVRKVIFPRRMLQERTLNLFCLLARYGMDLPVQLRTVLDREEGRHVFVEL